MLGPMLRAAAGNNEESPSVSLLLDYSDGLTITDASGNNMTIIEDGSVGILDTSPAPIGDYFLDFGALSGGNRLRVADNPNLRLKTTGWGMEAFIRLRYTNKHFFLFSKGLAGNLNDAWYFGLLSSGSSVNIAFAGKNNTTAFYQAYAPTADTTNFHHLSINSDGDDVTVYVDGVAVGTFPEPDIFQGAGDLFIGGWNYTTSNVAGAYADGITFKHDGPIRTGNFTI